MSDSGSGLDGIDGLPSDAQLRIRVRDFVREHEVATVGDVVADLTVADGVDEGRARQLVDDLERSGAVYFVQLCGDDTEVRVP